MQEQALTSHDAAADRVYVAAEAAETFARALLAPYRASEVVLLQEEAVRAGVTPLVASRRPLA